MDLLAQNFKVSLLNQNESEALYNLIKNNRPRLEDFFAGTVSRTRTLEDTQAYCEIIQQRIEEKSYFPYIIKDSKTNEFIGLVDVKNINWSIPKAEIGYLIDANFEGQGIITKALGMVVDYLIKTYHFKKLLCRADSKNTGSISVALKNGFQLEGTIRNDYKTTKGEIVDLNYYGRVFTF